VPTATICTDEFVSLGRTEARALGMPGLPLVVIPHPLGGPAAGGGPDPGRGGRGRGGLRPYPAEKLSAEYREQKVEPKSKFRPKPLFA
jgi:hypothetical protein